MTFIFPLVAQPCTPLPPGLSGQTKNEKKLILNFHYSSRESSILSDFSEIPIVLNDAPVKRPSTDSGIRSIDSGLRKTEYRRPSQENGRVTYEDDLDYVLEKGNHSILLNF